MFKALIQKIKSYKIVRVLAIQPQSIKHIFRIYTESFLIALFVAFVLRFFIVSTYRVSTHALEPDLQVGDYILSFKLPFSLPLSEEVRRKGNLRFIKKDNLVVYSCAKNTEKSCVGRVVALPNEKIERKYEEKTENYGARQFVERNKVLIFHKNSPTFKERVKQIPVENIEGKPFLIWLSIGLKSERNSGKFGSFNWSRFFRIL